MSSHLQQIGQYATLPRAADLAGVSPRTILRLVADGKIKATKPRGHWRINLPSLRQHLANSSAVAHYESDAQYESLVD